MFTVKCVAADDGQTYYLVNNWNKSKTFFIQDIPKKQSQLFSRKQDAQRSITMLLKVMDDYSNDKFTIMEV